jgi:ABC-type molybdate transport system permease subunit
MITHWDAHLYWGEEIFAMLIVLPPVLIGVALLCYFAPRIRRGF